MVILSPKAMQNCIKRARCHNNTFVLKQFGLNTFFLDRPQGCATL